MRSSVLRLSSTHRDAVRQAQEAKVLRVWLKVAGTRLDQARALDWLSDQKIKVEQTEMNMKAFCLHVQTSALAGRYPKKWPVGITCEKVEQVRAWRS